MRNRDTDDDTDARIKRLLRDRTGDLFTAADYDGANVRLTCRGGGEWIG